MGDTRVSWGEQSFPTTASGSWNAGPAGDLVSAMPVL